MGTGARRRALDKKLKSIEEEYKTKSTNQNPKKKDNGDWKNKK